VDFHAGVYQSPPTDVTGRDVIMVDFSYKRPVIEEMLKTAKSITIIDHHKTAIEDLEPLNAIASVGMDIRMPLYLYFDTNHSGAMLAWLVYFGDAEPPKLLQHIEDRDLWKFEIDGTREIQAAVFSYPYDFHVWDKLMESSTQPLKLQGEAIERKHFKDINELLEVTTRRMLIGGFNVPVANLPYIFSSDAGHKLATGEPFGACYWDTPKGRTFSLRSTDAGEDVSAIAKQYGGGGHRNASGFSVSYEDAMKFEVTP
jgi:oligoribonuclease NrnB/cAMP/cGMP phosphodiesterase (DHH superfamily)